MIQISTNQLETLELQCRRNFATHLTETINKNLLPFVRPSATNITDRIEAALTRAATIGISNHQALVHYVILCLILNDRFDEHPVIHEFIQAPGAEIHSKINALFFELHWHAQHPQASRQ